MACNRHDKDYLEDGLYQVNYKGICAGFEIENGELVRCAPILRKKFGFWLTQAKRINTENEQARTTG